MQPLYYWIFIGVMLLIALLSSQIGTSFMKRFGHWVSHIFTPKESIEEDEYFEEIGYIEFHSADPKEKEQFESGYVPWIGLDGEGEDREYLIAGDEVVYSGNNLILTTDYPFYTSYEKIIFSDSGFTRRSLLEHIIPWYRSLFEKEKTYGHDIGDLDLTGIILLKDQWGKVYGELDIES